MENLIEILITDELIIVKFNQTEVEYKRPENYLTGYLNHSLVYNIENNKEDIVMVLPKFITIVRDISKK